MTATQKVLHVAGYDSCGFFARAVSVLRSVAILFPTRLKVIQHNFHDRTAFRTWLMHENGGTNGTGFREHFPDPRAREHCISPFCWFSKTDKQDADAADIDKYLGSHDDTLEWCRNFLAPSSVVASGDLSAAPAPPEPAIMVPDGHTADHKYDYDLVVIGGGSGGMAAAKEAAALGAKVACLDFVKPSPKGSTWGLGGTCVNVGCIPKKLYHYGAQLNEMIRKDSPAFGITMHGTKDVQWQIPEPETQIMWDIMKDNIQNYIRSLNFKYRVRLREKEVAYLNKLGKFVDPHTIEAVDKKGHSSLITASRFLIAVGGRPAPLECEGGELAVSSDDIFSLEQNPGKTLCVGASYISLECAGFLAGLGLDVTVAVRSILLRGFDRECSDKIGMHMEEVGVKFKKGVTPKKLQKTSDGKIMVQFSDGSQDTYDTVLTAIGRWADTHKLGLENVGVQVNPKNRRIIGNNEQTSCPNIYALGDVLDGTPELTPVAIKAGITLAKRLFGGSSELMDYKNVCTTVFTPIEYSCVGLSEDEAIEKYGADNIEVYHREFIPLEWSLATSRGHSAAFAKVVVDKTPAANVLGIHYVGPNAGEVMQGYGVAMKQGLTFKQLTDTVGIHPTSSEEIVTLSVTKSSGEDAAAGGC